jgi:hypothetical protein
MYKLSNHSSSLWYSVIRLQPQIKMRVCPDVFWLLLTCRCILQKNKLLQFLVVPGQQIL